MTFDGTVRNHARDKPVTHLFYEAYDQMAVKEMEAIRERALARWPIRKLAIVHRVGRLEIGETSVFIAVSSDHRGHAFQACQFVIDELKRRVPIWKKELYADGSSIWVNCAESNRSGGSEKREPLCDKHCKWRSVLWL